VISTKGEVCAACLLVPLPVGCEPFGKSAVRAVSRWKFRPARRQGTPVAVLYYIGVSFDLGKGSFATPPGVTDIPW
jgi:hypothetical protein